MTFDEDILAPSDPATDDTGTPSHSAEISINENRYFPTQVFTFQLADRARDALNPHLVAQIEAARQQDAAGLEKSNFRALGGWHSQSALHHDPQFAPLTQLIERVGAQVAEKNAYHPNFPLKIGTMWAIINKPGSSNNAHVHPSSLWSGVYYVKAPKNCGDIEFIDPRVANTMAPAVYAPRAKRPSACWGKVTFTPTPGKLILFPSWLYHAVAPNLSTGKGADGERVIVSFNLSQQKLA